MANYKQKTLVTEHMPDIQIGGGGGSTSLPNTKIYTVKDIYSLSMQDMQGETVVYMNILDPEVSESISFSLSAGDNCAKSADYKYRVLTNVGSNLLLTIGSSFDVDKQDIDSSSEFFAVVYDATIPD